ncbi:MAG: UbiD family decarboxylase [Candidatus Tectomicrobia bacterium]|nr:UbiD family decarboxylase [Candidatus Tectomicrobia bacterium]
MAYEGFRGFLDCVRRAGEMAFVRREVDPDHQVSALIKRSGGKTVFCSRVKGSGVPLAANVLGSFRQLEILFDRPAPELIAEYQRRVRQPLPPRVVPDGPVKEVVLKGEEVDLREFPIPTVNEYDGGRFLTAGIIIVKDPEFGPNLSLQRLQVRGPRETGIFYNPVVHLKTYHERAEERGKPLEIAVAIGCDPALHIASQITRSVDVNEYGLAGALLGRPVELVRCETVDLEVPADAEIVLEGIIPPGVREDEGPFGEFTGYYHGSLAEKNRMPVIRFQAVTHRRSPIFQSVYLGKPPTEGTFMRALPASADLYNLVKEVVPEVRDVHFTTGGCGRFHVIVSIKKRSPGDGKLALSAILASRIIVKYAVIVDDDIDIRNMDEVEWAIATRSQFDRDGVVLTQVPGQLDPSRSRPHNLITKVGIDATRPDDKDFPKVCDVPRGVLAEVERNWEKWVTSDPEAIPADLKG